MDILSRPAEEFVNDPGIETAWVMKAVKHMEIHFNILRSVDPRHLRLTKYDEEIYQEFRKDFPETCINKVDVEYMKGPEGKEKWREFCKKFEHVPDFNYGTLLRISSEGDYSDENTVFVPRIQFYAFEIARNKEGFNDKIRHNFRTKDEQPESTDTTLLSSSIAMIKLCLESKFQAKCSIKKENGSTGKGDLSVFVQKNLQQIHPDTLNQIWPQGGAWKVTASRIQDNRLIFTFDRTRFFLNQLPSFCKNIDKRPRNGKCALVIVMGDDNHEEAESLRTNYLHEMLTNVLLFNRYCVHTVQRTQKNSEAIHLVPKFSKYNSGGHVNKDLMVKFSEKLQNFLETENGKIVFSAEKARQRVSSVFSNIPVHQKNILIKHDDQFSQAFQIAHFYESIVKKHMNTCKVPDVVYYIASQRKVHLCHQSALLWNALSNYDMKQHICIIHNTVHVPQNLKPTCDDIYRYKLKCVEDAMTHKYGQAILADETWSSRMDILSRSCLKTEILSVAAASPVTIHEDTKLGSFIQYNCARISNILAQYDTLINNGKLCKPEVADYSLLKKEEEWQLFWNYILSFPQLLQDVIEQDKKSIQFHKICNMLHCLSRDFSQYYGKVKIFTNVPQLEAIMHSRMSLLRCLLNVFEKGLELMDLPFLPEM